MLRNASRLMVLFSASLIVAVNAQTPTPFPVPIPGPVCPTKGVVSHTFYGSRADIEREVAVLESKITGTSSGRVWMMIVESSDSAEVYFYQRSQGGEFTKTSWQGATASALRSRLDQKMLESRGKFCAGEEMSKMVAEYGDALRHETLGQANIHDLVLRTVSTRSAGGYYRVTLMIPC